MQEILEEVHSICGPLSDTELGVDNRLLLVAGIALFEDGEG